MGCQDTLSQHAWALWFLMSHQSLLCLSGRYLDFFPLNLCLCVHVLMHVDVCECEHKHASPWFDIHACGGQKTTSGMGLCFPLYSKQVLFVAPGWLSHDLPGLLLCPPPISLEENQGCREILLHLASCGFWGLWPRLLCCHSEPSLPTELSRRPQVGSDDDVLIQGVSKTEAPLG